MDFLKSDFHNHSYLSYCARNEMTVENIIKRFETWGVKQAGITDHIYADGKTLERYRQIKLELDKIETNVKVFIGCEVDMVSPGKLIVDAEELEIFDYIMVAAPHYQGKGKVVPPLHLDYNSIAQNLFDYMISASTIKYADIIVHPFDARGLGVYMNDFSLKEAMQRIPDHALELIAANLKQNEIAVEINGKARFEEYGSSVYRFFCLCKEAGVKFSLGSDAHWLDDIYNIRFLEDYLKKLNIDQTDLWTVDNNFST